MTLVSCPTTPQKLGGDLLKLNGYTIDHQSDLAGANLSGIEIIDGDLSHSILAGANLAGSRAINVNWEGVHLNGLTS